MPNELRPSRLSNVVGQKQLVKRLTVLTKAAKARKQMLGHILFDGPPGLGKTTFAGCLSREMKMNFTSTIGSMLETIGDATEFFLGVKEKSIVFIDEIHTIPKSVEEYLYPVLEDGTLEIQAGSVTTSVQLPSMTIVGATTASGKMNTPFRDRFPNRLHLDYYQPKELEKLIQKNARILNLTFDYSGPVETIARASRGTPRIANNRLYWVRDWAHSCNTSIITHNLVLQAFEEIGVDEAGFEERDRKLLTWMTRYGKPAGIKSLASAIGINEETLENEIEPWLVLQGLVLRTPRGRQITEKGEQYVNSVILRKVS